jgi:pimeloyl-ACP methyl ester carboxylesterase
LSRWFNEDYLKKNPNDSQLVSTILENNDHQEFLKSYKLFSHFQDNMILFNQISAPTLIVSGEKEEGSTPEMSKKIGEIVKNSKVEIIPDGKHMCGMECADKVNQVFGNFLNDN